jgi:hypothetical protein
LEPLKEMTGMLLDIANVYKFPDPIDRFSIQKRWKPLGDKSIPVYLNRRSAANFCRSEKLLLPKVFPFLKLLGVSDSKSKN